MDEVIRAEKLHKAFRLGGGKTITALDHIDLSVKKGQLTAVIGPDGAGKTTLMRLIAGLMDPTDGSLTVLGKDSVKDAEEIQSRISYMPQKFGLYEDLTVMENLTFYADLFSVPQRERAQRFERLLGFSNLTPFKARLAGRLSGGMKQKLGLACALIHTPEILFLDEPTNGVDPVSRRDFWKILYDLLKDGITIFVSTAYLDEAERCTRIGLMHKGKLMIHDEPSRVKKSLGMPMAQLWTSDSRQAAEIAIHVNGVRRVSAYGDNLHIAIERKEAVSTVISALRAHGIEVKGERDILPSLEDIFIAMVQDEREPKK